MITASVAQVARTFGWSQAEAAERLGFVPDQCHCLYAATRADPVLFALVSWPPSCPTHSPPSPIDVTTRVEGKIGQMVRAAARYDQARAEAGS